MGNLEEVGGRWEEGVKAYGKLSISTAGIMTTHD